MSSIQELVRQATRHALNTLGSEKERVILRFLKSKSDPNGLPFRPIENTTAHDVRYENNAQIHTHETVFYIDGETMCDFRAYCNGKFARARITRIVNHRKETFKLLKERPFDELIENETYYRIKAEKVGDETI